MSDVEGLFLVLALLYLWECVLWVRRGTVLFRARWRRWRPVHPGTHLGNQHGGFAFAHPLPPLGSLCGGAQLPLSLSPEGVLAFVATSVNPAGRPPQAGHFLRWDGITSITTEGKSVRLNGTCWFRCGSSHAAQEIARQLEEVHKASPDERGETIRAWFAAMLNDETAQRLWREIAPAHRKLAWLGSGLFFFMFVIAPGLIALLGLSRCWPVLLAGWLALTVTTAIVFLRAHRRFYPAAGDERFTHFLTVLLAAPTAARAHDLLSRPLLETFHPLAVARALCTPDDFREFARQMVRELRHPALPLCPVDTAGAPATEEFSRNALREAAEAMLRKNGLEPDTLPEPPVPLDESCRSFCPRCGSQFTTVQGACADCGGLPLTPFSSGD